MDKMFRILRFIPGLCFLSFFYYAIKSLRYPGKFARTIVAYLATLGAFIVFSFIFNTLPYNGLRTLFGLFGFVAVFFAGTECFRKGIDK